ncbi:MAG: nitronate monooxygenase [Actinomycetales bacterium]|nr:nitronate monooxygenase [Actinomycetales bacterium]
MGVGVSSWQLANAVARTGQLGVVSGTALDVVVARRLQDGDPGGHLRRALAALPLRDVADRVLARYFRPEGRGPDEPYDPTPQPGLRPNRSRDELGIAGNFAEVWLAKQGHDGLIGINFLEKIQMGTPAAAYGAMLAGVDYVLMGAGIPRHIPSLLTELAANRPGSVFVDVIGGDPQQVTFDPASVGGDRLAPPARPQFLAIVSAHVLAAYLMRDEYTRPDGFVVEGPVAGGHNAPPRGQLVLDDDGQPVYGPRDEPDLTRMAALGLPFWMAGGYGEPERVRAALDAGAEGVQVGTLFALSRESGLADHLRETLLERMRTGTLEIRTDAIASPTGFPFKVAQLPGTLSDPAVHQARPRLCDLGYLRHPYVRENGAIGFRCPAEPVDVYIRKGGDEQDTVGCVCLCNALTANVGIEQHRREGYVEDAMVTLGSDLSGARRLDAEYWLNGGNAGGWPAAHAVAWLMREVHAPVTPPLPVV